MPNTTWASIHAKLIRLTNVDACGAPITGASNKSMLVTKGVVKVSINPEYEDGEETIQKDGNGDIDWQHEDPPQLKYFTVEAQFTRVNPANLTD